jgi:hypothetical protein
MIQPILWPEQGRDEYASPFHRGKHERPLRITLDVESFKDSAGNEKDAYELIRELGELDEIDIYSSVDDGFPWLDIKPENPNDGYKNVNVVENGAVISYNHGVNPSRYGVHVIQSLVNYSLNETEAEQAAKDLLLAEAHHAIGRDILITSSPNLLEHRDVFDYQNAFSSIEAAKLIGLFLRSRDIWIYKIAGNATFTTGKSMFYWVLTRTKLPNFWSYFSGCVSTLEFHGEEIFLLGQNILDRCRRLLQTRDTIGQLTYLVQDINTQDDVIFYFEYLTLLLAGVFDALAEITNIVYKLGMDKFNIGFRKKKFQKKLKESKGENLYNLISSKNCLNLMNMLILIRNKIHGAGINARDLAFANDPEITTIEIPDDIKNEIWQSSEELGNPLDWGLFYKSYTQIDSITKIKQRKTSISMDTYSYATKLVDTWFNLFDEIARLTDIELLFEGKDLPDLNTGPPKDWEPLIERSILLGDNAC